jgi:hypothetical protein
MGAEFGHVGARAQQRVSHAAPGMLVARRIFWVWGSLGTLGCAQLTHGAALRALSHHPIGVS